MKKFVYRINKALFTRILRRYGIEGHSSIPLYLGSFVQLTSNADKLLSESKIYSENNDISGGGTLTVITVPNEKRYTLKALRMGATANNARIQIYDPVTLKGFNLKESDTNNLILTNLDLPMEPSWQINIIGGGVGDNAIPVNIIYNEEDYY
jgi:pectate lyase